MAKRQILEDEFPSNSVTKRIAPTRNQETEIIEEGELIETPRKKRKAIGRGIVKKKTFAQSVAQTFFSEDSNNVVRYILEDVLIPAAKNTVSEMGTTFIEMLLFGEKKSSRGRGRNLDRTIVSYGSMYKDRDERSERRPSSSRGRFDLDEVTFRYGDEAAQILEELCDQLEKYDQVTVGDFYDLAGIEKTWVHEKWGWTDLRRARCTHTRNGYVIMFPKPEELE